MSSSPGSSDRSDAGAERYDRAAMSGASGTLGSERQDASTDSSPAARSVALVILVGGVLASTIALVIALSTYGKVGSYAGNPLGEFGAFGFSVTLLSLGFILRSRRPENRIGQLFLAFGVFAAFAAISWTTMLVGFLPNGDKGLGTIGSWVGAVVSTTTWTYLIAALVLRFPSGNPASAAEARLLRRLPVISIAMGVTTALRPGRILILPAFDNPVATPVAVHPLLTFASDLTLVLSLVVYLAAGVAMINRYRHASSVERLQLRWFAFGAGIVFIATTVYVIAGVMVAPTNTSVRELTYALFVVSLSSLPIAVFQAITSHHLYDIDRIIGRTFAYGALTAILAGLYSASVRLFNWVFVDVTGQGSEATLVLTTLVLATTFTPIKSRLEKAAEKRFKFDARAGQEALAPSPPAAIDPAALAALERHVDERIDSTVQRAVDAAIHSPKVGPRRAR